MEQITLIKRNGTKINLFNKDPFRTVKTATQSKSLMSVDTVTLNILSREILTFDKGDRIQVNGEDYYIRTKVNRELVSDGYYKYDAVFYGVLYDLMKTPYRDMDANGNSNSSTFDLVYTLKEYIHVLINNVKHDYPGLWTFNETGCPDKDPIAFQFSCNNCLEVLQQVCQKFKVDFRITQLNGVRTIQIGQFGTRVTPPDGSSYFEWGRGKGLYSLKENKVDDKSIKTRLWVEGGTSNLPTGYRNYAMRLQLPLLRKNTYAHTLSDGTKIAAGSEYIGITSENARYIEDTELSNTLGVDADSVLYDEIVPTRTGTVTAIVEDDVYSFYDTSMDFDINDSLVDNVSAKVTFTTGKLAGQTLEITEYDAKAKKFTIIPYQDNRGLLVPTKDSTAFRIEKGNSYKLTDIIMPPAIIAKAEEDLWYAGYDDLRYLKQARVQYSLELNRMRLIETMPSDSDTVLFKPGDYVPVKDTRFGVEKNIRIQKVERNLLLRHDYQITISDTATIDIFTQAVIDTQNHETIIINNGLKDLTKAKRSWRTTEELRNMVFDTDGYFDTDNFRANTIDTNMLTVGSKSQQFVLSGVVIQPNYGGNANRFVVSAGNLSHLTINEDSVRTWRMSATDTTLTNASGYYLYARCPKGSDSGMWLITQTQYKADPGGEFYYFLVGIIGSKYEDDNFRDFVTTYGFTRINGNTITTGKIQSANSECYFDLDNNIIYGNITIRSGSGYNNLSDKPDLSVYAEVSELNVTKESISAISQRVDNVEGTISSAGWITKADGNTWWAKKSMEDGNEIIAYINQTATTTTINSARINLVGAVTFSMFGTSLQNLINGKADSSSLGTLAGKNSVVWNDLASALQSTINSKLVASDLGDLAFSDTVSYSDLAQALKNTIDAKANSNSLGSLAFLSSVSSSELAQALKNTINGKADSSSLGTMAGKSSVSWSDLATALQNIINDKIEASYLDNDVIEFARLGSTIVEGGYIKTGLLNVIKIAAVEGTIAGLNISDNSITSVSGAYDGGSSASKLSNTQFHLYAKGNAKAYLGYSGSNVRAELGLNTYNGSNSKKIMCDLRDAEASAYTYTKIGLYIDIYDTYNAQELEYNTSVTTNVGATAIYIDRGHVTGLKRHLRHISGNNNCTLTKDDSIVHLHNTSSITVTLPSGCEDGQEIWILPYNTTVKVKPNSGGYIHKGSDNSETEVSCSGSQYHIFIYCAYNGRWIFGYLSK